MLDVIVVTRCSGGLVDRCLRSIAEHVSKDTLSQCRFALCSTSGLESDAQHLRQLLSELGLSGVVDEHDYNYAKCNNYMAKRHCRGDKLLLLNDDVELVSDVITPCMMRLDDKVVGTVGVKLVREDGSSQHEGMLLETFKSTGMLRGVGHLRDASDGWTVGNTGALLMIRRELFDRCGGFDEGFRVCFEDVVLNLKCLALGHLNLTLNSLKAIHSESATRGKSIDRDDIARLAVTFNNNRELILRNVRYFRGATYTYED